MILFRSDDLRGVFLSLDDSLPCLLNLLDSPNHQLLYDALHCAWLLSLKRAFHEKIEKARTPIRVLRVLRPGLPLKVLRVGIGLLVNLMRNPSCGDTMTVVVESVHFEGLLTGLSASAEAAGGGGGAGAGHGHAGVGQAHAPAAAGSPAITDPELTEDVRWARETIAAKGGRFGAAFSNVERYAKELEQGSFHWTSLHTPQFWRENARHFERDACSLLKQLARLITVRFFFLSLSLPLLLPPAGCSVVPNHDVDSNLPPPPPLFFVEP
jgi:hypothetical protein